MPAARLSTMIIACYFATMAILQTTTPILFSLVVTPLPYEKHAPTLIGTPILLDTISELPDSYDELETLRPLRFDWYSTSAILNLFKGSVAFSSDSRTGLHGNRVYDTLLTPSSNNGTATVAFTDFDVKCGMVPNANISTSESMISWVPDLNVFYSGISIIAAFNNDSSSNSVMRISPKFNLTDYVEYFTYPPYGECTVCFIM